MLAETVWSAEGRCLGRKGGGSGPREKLGWPQVEVEKVYERGLWEEARQVE